MNVINTMKGYVSTVFDLGLGVTEAIDVVAIQQDAPVLHTRTTPFYVRFEGTKHHENRVEIRVNGIFIPGVTMELDTNGEAYFLHQPEDAVIMEEMFYTDEYDEHETACESEPTNCMDDQSSFNLEGLDLSISRDLNSDLRNPSVYFDAFNSAPPSIEKVTLKKNTSDYFDASSEDAPRPSCTSSEYCDLPHHEVLHLDADDSVPILSLCGHVIQSDMTPEEVRQHVIQHQVTGDEFRSNPISILGDPNLMISVHGVLHRYDLFMQSFLVSKVCFPVKIPSVPHMLPPIILPPIQSEKFPLPASAQRRLTDVGSKPNDHELHATSRQTRAESDPSHSIVPSTPSRWFRWFRSTNPTEPCDDPVERRVYYPSQTQLRRMGLVYGENKIEFRVKSNAFHEADKVVVSTLYLWHASTKLVLADVESTISVDNTSFMRSSSRAVVDGAVDFYKQVVQNGYQIIYLSSRRHQEVRELVDSLPHGPLLGSFGILRDGEQMELKLSLLQQIQALYPIDVNPFYAALTSEANADVFLHSGLHPGKLLVMDTTTGRFSLAHQKVSKQQQSYNCLRDTRTFDAMFPPIYSVVTASIQPHLSPTLSSPTAAILAARRESRTLNEDAFNDLNFWKLPPPRLAFNDI